MGNKESRVSAAGTDASRHGPTRPNERSGAARKLLSSLGRWLSPRDQPCGGVYLPLVGLDRKD